MKIVPLDLKNKNFLPEIIQALKQGKVIIYPTDTLYGFGVHALDKAAIDRLFRIKKRPPTKPMPIIVRDISMARCFAYVDLRNEKVLRAIWPGSITVVLSKKDTLPSMVTGGKNTVGIRIPNYEFTKALTEQIDFPITSTSVNISGEEPLRNIPDIARTFEKERYKPDIIIDAGELPLSQASTIIDLTTSKPKILRVGPVRPEELLKILEI